MIDEKYINKQNVEKWGPIRYTGPGILLYEYVRGSHAYGLATEKSDQDRGGAFMISNDALLGMTQKNTMFGYSDLIHTESNDENWYEFSRFAELLTESNPNILESLFIGDEFVIYEHPIITELKAHRDSFVTKESFAKFGGYAKAQIQKAKGLNKKIVKPVTEKKSPIDFVYTFYNQGSTKISNWLAYRGLNQEFVGLVAIPNMHNTYGLYYDWAWHIDATPGLRNALEKMYRYRNLNDEYDFNEEELLKIRNFEMEYARTIGEELDKYTLYALLKRKPKFYKGIVKENSQELRLSSVPEKEDRPITHIVYNQEGYSKHANDYASYKKWEKERNPERYSLNKGHEFDAKNMMHSFRLILMAIEIAKGDGVNVWRSSDRQFLLDIRNHKHTYEELMEMLEKLDDERKSYQETSTIPDTVDKEKLNEWVIKMRKKFGNF